MLLQNHWRENLLRNVMIHQITIGGSPVELEWTQASARAFHFRLSEIGFSISGAAFKGARAASSFCKCLWALLPADVFREYPTPEELFVAIDHETEAAAIYGAVSAIFAEMAPSDEKKSTSKNSHSPGSNSD